MKHGELRKQTVMQILRTSKKLTIEKAMKTLDVSESTVRRLFTQLEEDGDAIRVYGGICYNDASSGGTYFEPARLKNADEKVRIGHAAEQLIKAGDILFLDSGTTVMALSAEIDRMFTEARDVSSRLYEELHRKYSEITLFTHSLANLEMLKKHMKVHLIGGEYRDGKRDFHGYLAEEAIKKLRFTKCFIGADGFSESSGVLASDFGTARINQLALQNSSYKILLVDSSKLGNNSVVSFSPLSNINCLVTDKAVPEDLCARLREGGMTVITA
jgi:DeoR/GlpR family transcriptional regulator of sugar metabolism